MSERFGFQIRSGFRFHDKPAGLLFPSNAKNSLSNLIVSPERYIALDPTHNVSRTLCILYNPCVTHVEVQRDYHQGPSKQSTSWSLPWDPHSAFIRVPGGSGGLSK